MFNLKAEHPQILSSSFSVKRASFNFKATVVMAYVYAMTAMVCLSLALL